MARRSRFEHSTTQSATPLEALQPSPNNPRAETPPPLPAPPEIIDGQHRAVDVPVLDFDRASATRMHRVPDRVLGYLSDVLVEGDLVHRYGVQLDRKDYDALNKVLEALGGKWTRGRNGHVFPADVDVADRIDAAILTGEVVDPRGNDCFFTPLALAYDLVDRAEIKPGVRVLEPNAGQGAIALALVERGEVPPSRLFLVELLEANRLVLARMGFHVSIYGDFLQVPVIEANMVDRVVMNPPFSKRQEIAHVRHAFELLRPGGVLVSVMSAGIAFRQDKLTTDFREWVEAHGSFEELPDNSFRAAGTSVRTIVATVRR